MFQLIEQCCNDEKKVGREHSLEAYRMLMQLFPLFKRFTVRVELQISVNNESNIRLREVKKALLNSSFSDCPTNFLTTHVKYATASE